MAAIKRVIESSVPGTLAEGTEVFVEDGSGGLDLYIGDSSNSPVLVSENQFLQSGDVVEVSDIIDNLTSTDPDKPLSANQGKVLNDTKTNVSDIVDNLTSTDTDKPLSANQGKTLDETKADKNENCNPPRTSSWELDITNDSYRIDRCTSSDPETASVPENSTDSFPIGYWRVIRQAGAGQVTVQGIGGVTINGDSKTAGQDKGLMLVKVDTDEWDCYGGIS